MATLFHSLGPNDVADIEGFKMAAALNPSTQDELMCDICFHIFPDWHTLQRHRLVHSGDKMSYKTGSRSRRTRCRNFQCELCPKMFTDRWNLQQHQRVHTGERPYACEKCGRKFAKKYNMQSHMAIHFTDI
ncbi:zinc finger protein 235-like [Ruditapes philippinarum]|uniref:zinc finger protein 235-like n=1 Tax=Ruditapes philippinarum TaxID=129788 RepID=UPI00295AAAF9|nr:zinc finger protein 235-like [Ruditapes philippinarum]